MPARTLIYRLVRFATNRLRRKPRPGLRSDYSEEEQAIIRRVQPYTMTGPERIVAVVDAVRYVVRNDLPGAVVECGVWRGGSMMAAATALLAEGDRTRPLYLFDTFAGMTEPGAEDVSYKGELARERFDRLRAEGGSDWCRAGLRDVEQNMRATGYDMDRVHFVEGKVEETIPAAAPEQIAILRLDTDWYQSTRHEMEHLYPRLVPGGVLIIDDYGHWKGARKAVDEYFRRQGIHPLLHRTDLTGRVMVKA